jgi:hypothetical protein
MRRRNLLCGDIARSRHDRRGIRPVWVDQAVAVFGVEQKRSIVASAWQQEPNAAAGGKVPWSGRILRSSFQSRVRLRVPKILSAQRRSHAQSTGDDSLK